MACDEIRRCTRCVTPALWPGISFDSEGVCSLCRAWDRKFGTWLTDPSRREKALRKLVKLISWAKRHRRGDYEALVPISGGKDSLYVLYWLRKNTDLSIITYTYDNGLFHDTAKENIRVATTCLKVHHVWDQLPFQTELMRHHLLKAGNFCGACVVPYLVGSYVFARSNGIPLIVFGLSRRNDPNLPDGINPFYFRNVTEDGFGMARFWPIWGTCPELRYIADTVLGRLRVITLPDYLDWNEAFIGEELVRNLGVSLGVEHSDCIGHEVADWLAVQRYGFGYATVKASQLIRLGQKTREEGLKMVEERTPTSLPESAAEVARRLGVTVDEILEASKRPMKAYFKGLLCYLAVLHRKRFFGR